MTPDPTLYPDLAARLAPLERRTTRYRFDLERDVPWEALGAPGLRFGPAWLERVGIDAAALERAGVGPRFQWAWALALTWSFHAFEALILRFAAEEAARLGGTRSLELLCEEERKHIEAFRRAAEHLRAEDPAGAARLEASLREGEALLGDFAATEEEPAVRHYLFWLNTLFFEELTVLLDDALAQDHAAIQPAWRALHATHRREEVQHVVTDAGYLDALSLDPARRAALSKRFLFRLERGFDRLFGLDAVARLLAEESPASAGLLAGRALRERPLFRSLLHDPAFRRTREAAPYLQELAFADGAPARAATTAEAHGPPLVTPLPASLPAVLLRAAAEHGDAGVTWLDDDGSEALETHPQLLLRARRLLTGLRARGGAPGDHVLLLVPRARDLLGVFWGGLLGGLVPVPAAPPVGPEDAPRVRAIHARLHDPLVVCDPASRALVPAEWRVVGPDELLADEPAEPSPGGLDDPAFVQFSSGSTGAPRGVVLTHRNVLSDLLAVVERQRVTQDDVVVSWMPLHHDMGLAFHVCPLLVGAAHVLLPTSLFARRPLRWLEVLSRRRATFTGATNFALGLLLRRASAGRLVGLDLSRVRCVLVGAEPISADLLERCALALAPAGLRREALCPAYGLAEATVAVSFGAPGDGPRAHTLVRASLDDPAGVRDAPPRADGVRVVDLGPPLPGCAVRIVDATGALVDEGVAGEVLVRGAGVTRSYLDDPEATREVLRPDGWLRTGDLGLLRGGRLLVTGRAKDVIFVHGRNVLAPDLERVVEAIDELGPGRAAAFGSTEPHSGQERLVLALHLRPGQDRDALAAQAAARVSEAARYPVHTVLVLPASAFPRGTSGKLQRHALRRAFEAGDLDAFARRLRVPPPEADAGVDAGADAGADAQPPPGSASRDALHDRSPGLDEVRAVWARVLGLAPAAVDPDRSFFAQGGDSIRAVEVHSLLEERCGRLLDQRVLLDGSTPRAMAAAVALALGRDAPASTVTAPASTVAPQVAPRAVDEPIAIVALACRFAGAASPAALWELLRRGGCAVGPIPPARWSSPVDGLHDPAGGPGKTVCATGSFLDDVRGFDAERFGIPVDEAREIDPQQRLFLELAAEVLDAGGDGNRRVGVFAGAGGNQYLQPRGLDPRRIGPHTAHTNLPFMTAARVARALGLTGPAFTVDAACATSVVSVHLACRSLLAGECDAAIAGGVELLLTETPYLLFSQAGVLSRTGACRPFGAEADGFVPGEGGGAVLLKTLSAARRDGDPILAVLRGGAVNNDGGSLGSYTPNPAGQRAVLEAAYRQAGVDPTTIGYVEAHGTGTPVGDPVEVRALAQVLGAAGAGPGTVGLGSIKSNLGHALNAAGIASLIKVVLALRAGELPPTLGCDPPHPDLRLAGTPLFLVRERRPWPTRQGAPRRAGVSAFGIGGTNCHLVVEEAPPPRAAPDARDAELLCLGAPSPAALARVAAAAAEALRAGADLADFAAAASPRAARFAQRRALVLRDRTQALEALAALGAAAPGAARPAGAPRVAWVFPGPGSHHAGMGAHLRGEPAFAAALAECEAILAGRLGRPLVELFDAPALDRIEVTQPVLFAFEYALARWLSSLGLAPDALIGHSMGEYVAACLGGALDLRDALELVLARGRAMRAAPPGRMAAVFASAERVQPVLGAGVDLAAINEPGQVVLSGEAAALEGALAALSRQGIEAKPLTIDCAAHSALMDAAQAAFSPALARVAPCAPAVPLFSTRTGARVERLDAAHWRAHLREPVRFMDAVRAARRAGIEVFLEVGPGAALSACVEECVSDLDGPALPLLRRSIAGWAPTLETLGRLFEVGAPLEPARLAGARRASVPPELVPAYPWDRRPCWIEAAAPAARVERETTLDLGRRVAAAQHLVHGKPVAPSALLLDLVLAELRAGPCALDDVVIGRPLTSVADERGDEVTARSVRVRRAGSSVVLESRDARAAGGAGADTFQEHLSARLAAAPSPPPPRDLAALRARCPDEVEPARLYAHLEAVGMAYGPAMQAVVLLRRGAGEVLARLEPPAGDHPFVRLHPALIDGAIHAVGALVFEAERARGTAFLGLAFRRIELHAPVTRGAWAHVRLRSERVAAADVIRCDVEVLDDAGRVLASFEDVGLKRFAGWSQARFHQVDWAPAPLAATRRPLPGRASTLVVGPATGLRALLQERVEAAGGVAPATAPPVDAAGWEAAARRWLAPRDGVAPALVLFGAAVEDVAALARALVAAGVRDLHDALLVTDDAAAVGFWRVAGRERPGWRCRALWAGGRLDAPGLAATLASDLVAELERAPEWFLVRHRDGTRQALGLTPLEAPGREPALRHRGVYWITGGLGGLGRTIAEGLAARTSARLLLTGRRAAADPEALARLVALGGEPLYVQADAADRPAMQRAREQALARWGRLDGVVHAAGVVDDAPLETTTPSRTRAVLAPKREGARHLVELTRADDLDFLALFSSIAALYGVPGQADYAAANASLDGLAQGLERGRTHVVAIDWGPWRDVGMSALDPAYRRSWEAQGLRPFASAAGARAFFQALEFPARQVVAVDLAPDAEAEFLAEFNRLPGGGAAPRADAAAAGPLREVLRDLLARALSCRPGSLDPGAPFSRLGLDSLMAIGVVRALERRYGLPLYPTLLFEHASIDALAAHLEAAYGVREDRAAPEGGS